MPRLQFADRSGVLTFIPDHVQPWALLHAVALTLLVAGLSFLPPAWKVLLHTRGAMHFWAHLYAFMALCVLFFRGLQRPAHQAAAVVGLALLGFGIESAQAHQQVAAFEVQDLVCDVLGIVAGVVTSLLRAPACGRNRLPTLEPEQFRIWG